MPTRNARPKRSRAGLFVLLAALAWGAFQLTSSSAPSFDSLAFRPLPYAMYGWKPEFTRATSESVPFQRSTNADGFRGPAIVRPKPPGAYRIVCLGGSTTYTSYVDDGETYPELLQARLREARPELGIEVINAGVESYTSAESLNNLAFRCLELEPDAIVVYHGANDFRPRRYPDFDPGYLAYRKPWDGTTDDYVARTGELGGINGFIQQVPRDSDTTQAENVRAHGPEVFGRNLRSLVGVARAHGIRTIFVTMAASDAKCPAPLKAGIAEHNEVVRQICRDADLLCIDLSRSMSQAEGMFHDSVHVTPRGSALKAQLIAEELAPALP
jgi:lysophospholipase L1-like esterase